MTSAVRRASGEHSFSPLRMELFPRFARIRVQTTEDAVCPHRASAWPIRHRPPIWSKK